MMIRPYHSEDCPEMAALFYDTVHSVNAADYTKQQLDAWASGDIDLVQWDRRFRESVTLIAVQEEPPAPGAQAANANTSSDSHRTQNASAAPLSSSRLLAFGNIDSTGYLDMLYVHKDHQRKGLASALCDRLEAAVPNRTFTTHASITARPFFEHRGYRVIRAQQVVRRGVALTNFVMEKRQEKSAAAARRS